MMIFLAVGKLMFFVSIMSFSLKRKHLLLMLMSLEFIVLIIYYVMFIYLSEIGHELFFSMIFLTMSVAEGVLGLSILVSMIRSHGNDYFQSFSILW